MNRRRFLTNTGAAGVGVGFSATSSFAAPAEGIQPVQPNSTKLGWKISVQQWTYRRVPLFEGLEMAAKVGLRCFEPRSILKLDSKRPWPER